MISQNDCRIYKKQSFVFLFGRYPYLWQKDYQKNESTNSSTTLPFGDAPLFRIQQENNPWHRQTSAWNLFRQTREIPRTRSCCWLETGIRLLFLHDQADKNRFERKTDWKRRRFNRTFRMPDTTSGKRENLRFEKIKKWQHRKRNP